MSYANLRTRPVLVNSNCNFLLISLRKAKFEKANLLLQTTGTVLLNGRDHTGRGEAVYCVETPLLIFGMLTWTLKHTMDIMPHLRYMRLDIASFIWAESTTDKSATWVAGIMAVFFTNVCKFSDCGLTFPSLRQLIEHIEDAHIGELIASSTCVHTYTAVYRESIVRSSKQKLTGQRRRTFMGFVA